MSTAVVGILARAFAAFLGLEEEEDMSRVRHKGRKERREDVQVNSRSGGITLEDYDPSTGQVGINRKHRKKKNKQAPPKEHRKCAYVFATRGVKDDFKECTAKSP